MEVEKSASVFLRDIQRELLKDLPGKIEEMGELLRSIAAEGWPKTGLEDLHRLAHTIVGECSTFGFLLIGEAARRLEHLLLPLLDEAVSDPRILEVEIERQIDAIRQSALRYSVDVLPALPNMFPRGSAAVADDDRRLIFLVDDNQDFARSLAFQLRHFGYQVMVFDRLRDVEKCIQELAPKAVVMDIMLPEGKMAGPEFIAELRRDHRRDLHVVFISVRSDLEARLQAFRAGGNAYFTKPVDVQALAEKLDQMTGRNPGKPFEVLIVDDDHGSSSLHAEMLRRAGMRPTIVTDPMAVLDRLEDFRPDLILLDVCMPQCRGPELAAVLRQHERFLSIPIVFLSNLDDPDEQVAALVQGGDEFLNKPIDQEHLVTMVRARAEHGRLLNTMINQDGLTGLMNHSRQKQQLEIELRRAAREGTALTFVMLDLDDFKLINDTYGHTVGDRVLRSVAGILKQRLRRTDVIARYGGDEFAVLLPNTAADEAKELFEEIGASFAQLTHGAGNERFTTTLSCGLASFPRYSNAEALAEAADQALYEAKRQGRQQVVLAA